MTGAQWEIWHAIAIAWLRRNVKSATFTPMKIAVLREARPRENRVAATPDTVKRFAAIGAEVCVESGAGERSGIADAAYIDAGADAAATAAHCLEEADIILCVNAPETSLLVKAKKDAALVGMLEPYDPESDIHALTVLNAFALELLPRISRAQAMDVLSSQSNLAGYRAVIEAVAELGKAMPMMMTAAGTIRPARVLVLGAGVAGLQAIATAKRLGAAVSAFDVRPAVREQVESLGATFIEVPADPSETGEAKGGYANEMSEEYKRRQAELVTKTAAAQDIIITTALIPGKPAPLLIDRTTLEGMKPGSVIVDLAAASGGNCAMTRPDETVEHYGVKILGPTNLPSRVAADASALYARNLFNFVSALMVKDGVLEIDWTDALITATCLTKDGEIDHPQFKGAATVGTKKRAAKNGKEASDGEFE